MTAPGSESRRDGERGGRGAAGQAEYQQGSVLGQHHHGEVTGPVPDRAQQGQLPPPLQHIAQQHGGEPDSAEHKPEPAECAESRQVRVLDAVESGEPGGGRLDIETEIRERLFKRAAYGVELCGGSLDQEKTVTLGIGVEPQEILLGDEQLGLEDAVVESGDNAEAGTADFEVLSELRCRT